MNDAHTRFKGIGERIRKARKERGLTQDQLAGNTFTKGYISALERGSIRPSLKALDFMAAQLEMPLSYFVAAMQEELHERNLELEAFQEELEQRLNYAEVMIMQGTTASIAGALALLHEAETYSSSSWLRMPAGVHCRIHLLRGQAHMYLGEHSVAREDFERALAISLEDGTALGKYNQIISRNALGTALYELQQPKFALEQYKACAQELDADKAGDPTLRLNVLAKLAKCYDALDDVDNFVATSNIAAALAAEHHSIRRLAEYYFAQAEKLQISEWVRAKKYATRALHLIEAADTWVLGAEISMDLSELLASEKRFLEGRSALTEAESLSIHADNSILQSRLYYKRAELERAAGELDSAMAWVSKGLAIVAAEQAPIGDAAEATEGANRGSVEISQSEIGAADFEEGGRDDLGAEGFSANNKVPTPHSKLYVLRVYVDALQLTGLIEQERGNYNEADGYFQRSIALASEAGLSDTLQRISYKYGELLQARGVLELAMKYYRISAQAGEATARDLRPHTR